MLGTHNVLYARCFQGRYANNLFDAPGWRDWEHEPLDDADCDFVVSCCRRGEAAKPLEGLVQEDLRRGLAFENFETASDYLLRLIRSATIDDFTLMSLVPNAAFFEVRISNGNRLKVPGCNDLRDRKRRATAAL